MLVCMWYTELTCIPYSGLYSIRTDIVSQVLGPSVCVCGCDQLSAQVVFMKLSENLIFKVVPDFDLLPTPRARTLGSGPFAPPLGHGPWGQVL